MLFEFVTLDGDELVFNGSDLAGYAVDDDGDVRLLIKGLCSFVRVKATEAEIKTLKAFLTARAQTDMAEPVGII